VRYVRGHGARPALRVEGAASTVTGGRPALHAIEGDRERTVRRAFADLEREVSGHPDIRGCVLVAFDDAGEVIIWNVGATTLEAHGALARALVRIATEPGSPTPPADDE